MRESINLDAYLAARVTVTNAAQGSRGYDYGVRTFNCPLCREDRGRGWLNVERWTAGCWNAGCVAEPRITGGAIEWVREVEGLQGRGQTWRFLLEYFPSTGAYSSAQPKRDVSTVDFCHLPREFRHVDTIHRDGALGRPVELFLLRQWGLTLSQASDWGLGYCPSGRHGGRVIIPIWMNGELVAFQSRSYRGAEPKYLNSVHGPESNPRAECGRPAGEVLFNIDGTPRGGEALLVEGPGDVMHWHRWERLREPHAIGLLGLALTPEKLAVLRELAPSKVTVAMDNEPAARLRAFSHMEDLAAWGLVACLGEWRGSKDAGAGAELKVWSGNTLLDRVKTRMGG